MGLASAWPIKEEAGNPYLALDLPVLLACAFVLGPVPAGLVALVAGTSPQELRGRVTLSRSVWNHAQVSLSVTAAGVVFVVLNGDLAQWPAVLVAAELALLADTLVNYVSVSLIYAVGSSADSQTSCDALCGDSAFLRTLLRGSRSSGRCHGHFVPGDRTLRTRRLRSPDLAREGSAQTIAACGRCEQRSRGEKGSVAPCRRADRAGAR